MRKKNYAKTAPSKDAIWHELSEQHHHQSIKKHYSSCPIITFFGAKKV